MYDPMDPFGFLLRWFQWLSTGDAGEHEEEEDDAGT